MGTYFGASQTFAMYKHGKTATPDFSDIDKQIEGTAIHEIAHGIFQYAEADFVKTFDFWLDEDTASGKTGAEPPPTEYGKTSAAEDLAECAMLYFLDRARLPKDCPLRCAFMDKLVKGWEPEPLKGGWPELPKDTVDRVAPCIAGYQLADLLALRGLSRDELQARLGAPRGRSRGCATRASRASTASTTPPPSPATSTTAATTSRCSTSPAARSRTPVPGASCGTRSASPRRRSTRAPARTPASTSTPSAAWPSRPTLRLFGVAEIFPPTTLDAYQSGIYKDPGEFIR